MDGFFNLLNSHDQGHLGGSTQKIILSAFTLTGVLFLSAKLLSFIRLILSLFVLPGKPVNTSQIFFPVSHPFTPPTPPPKKIP